MTGSLENEAHLWQFTPGPSAARDLPMATRSTTLEVVHEVGEATRVFSNVVRNR